jgi:ADP-ribosylglycohydrolase
MNILLDKIYGCLLGGMIGDAFGAPGEGMTYSGIQEKYGKEGIVDFEGTGTDDTAVRNQLVSTILKCDGYPNVDEFAQSFIDSKDENYRLWFIPVKNSFHKFSEGLELPAYSGWGNMQSSSTAMAISPMGIINAGNPRQAALETVELASLIHNGPTGFCRDAASAIAAAVAAAFKPNADVGQITESAKKYLMPVSSKLLLDLIDEALDMAEKCGTYEDFREEYYRTSLRQVLCDSRETIPATFALLKLSDGDPRKAITWAANFGRDADTIGAMIGGIVGALHGASGLPEEWVTKATNASTAGSRYSGNHYSHDGEVSDAPKFDDREIANQLEAVIKSRLKDLCDVSDTLHSMSE